MRRLILFFAMLAAAGTPADLHAQQVVRLMSKASNAADITANGQTGATLDTGSLATVGFEVTNTFTGTIELQCTIGGSTFVPLTLTPSNSTTTTAAITGTGVWTANVAGCLSVRARSTTAWTGTATTRIVGVSTGGGGAGGGGGGGAGTVAQGSATSGQLGMLTQCATTTGAPLYTTGTTNPCSTDVNGAIRVAITSGAGSGGTALADRTGTFTPGATSFTPIGGYVDDTTTDTLAEGNPGALRLTTLRAAHTNPRDTAGAQLFGTAAASADGVANPTIGNVQSFEQIFNGTTWDRVRSVTNGQNTTGTGVIASGILGQFDDTATGAVTENQFAPIRISTRRAVLVEGVASGTAIGIDSELPAAAALADATANPTTTSVAAFNMCWNGTTWDRCNSGGATTSYLTSAATTNATSVKASAGTIYTIRVNNTTSTLYYLRMYNLSTAPTCSSAIGFVETIPLSHNSGAGAWSGADMSAGQAYTTGIAYCITAGGSSTDNTAAATGLYVTIIYR